MKKFTRGHIESFLSRFKTDGAVLDIGAGGTEYASLFPNRTTLDIDPERNPDIVGDAEALPVADEAYDLVICSEALEHIKDPRRAVSEMNRVLKPGGIAVITTRFLFPIHDAPHDYWRFTPYSLRMLFSDWEILAEHSESDTFSTIAVLLQRIMFQTDVRGGKLTKGLVYLVALFLSKLDGLVLSKYGDIKRTKKVDVLFSSGLYIACKKR